MASASGAGRPKVLISAGEASGDLHAAHLVEALLALDPSIELFGLGGERMAESGVELIVRNEQISVTGIVEVLSHLPQVYGAFRRLISAAEQRRPALAVLVDYPDFHLLLAKRLVRAGIPVVYYISPQVWAWREGRLKTIKKLVSHMIVILPFEEQFYRAAGVPVTFVGHPLRDSVRASQSREEFFREHRLDPALPLVTLLPGSRRKEVGAHLPVLLGAHREMKVRSQFVIQRAPSIERGLIEQIAGGGAKIVEPGAYDAQAHADLVLTSCGTATLETALCGTPMIAFYRLSPVTYILGKPLVRMDTYAMCNILGGRRIVPELIQGDFTTQRVAAEADAILGDPERSRTMREDLLRIAGTLGPPGAAARAAAKVLEVLRG